MWTQSSCKIRFEGFEECKVVVRVAYCSDSFGRHQRVEVVVEASDDAVRGVGGAGTDGLGVVGKRTVGDAASARIVDPAWDVGVVVLLAVEGEDFCSVPAESGDGVPDWVGLNAGKDEIANARFARNTYDPLLATSLLQSQ